MASKQASYTTYGQIEHNGETYVVTVVDSRSKYFLRVWRAGAVGIDPVVSVRDPGEPAADWHPGYESWPEAKKDALVNKSLKTFREGEGR